MKIRDERLILEALEDIIEDLNNKEISDEDDIALELAKIFRDETLEKINSMLN